MSRPIEMPSNSDLSDIVWRAHRDFGWGPFLGGEIRKLVRCEAERMARETGVGKAGAVGVKDTEMAKAGLKFDSEALNAFVHEIGETARYHERRIDEVPGDYETNRHRRTAVSILTAIASGVDAMMKAGERTEPAKPADDLMLLEIAKRCCNPSEPDLVKPSMLHPDDWLRAEAVMSYIKSAGAA